MSVSTRLPERLFALDLGTTKFCIAALRTFSTGQAPLLETISVPAAGMRRGMVADLEKAATAIASLLEAAEKQFDCDIRSVVVGIAGSHLGGKKITSSLALEGAAVTFQSLKTMSQQAEVQNQVVDREILHTIPLHFRIDNRDAIENPVGFSGRMLHGEYFLINADQPYLKDIVRLCNQCGLEVKKLYSEPFASASVTVDDVKKEVGVVIADIGGGTTDGIVFQQSKPCGAFSVNIAGSMMTSDLAIGLNLSPAEAERVKVFFGLSPDQNRSLNVRNLNGEIKQITGRDVFPILGSRIYELGTALVKELITYKGKLGAGLLLTGGGSEVQGIDTFLHRYIKIPVAKVFPSLPTVNSATNEPRSSLVYPSKFATALGLLNLEICRLQESAHDQQSGWPMKYVNHLKMWLRELA